MISSTSTGRRHGQLSLVLVLATGVLGPATASARYSFQTLVNNQGGLDALSIGSSRPLNDNGEISFWAQDLQTFSQAYLRTDGTNFTTIATYSVFSFNSSQTGSLNNAGMVVFHGNAGGGEGIYQGNGGLVSPVLVDTTSPPDPEWIISGAATINDDGAVAFRGARRNFPDHPGQDIEGYYLVDDEGVHTIVEEGAVYTGPGSSAPALNNNGEAAMSMSSVAGTGYHVIKHTGSAIETIATGFSAGQQISMNNLGDVAYVNQNSTRLMVYSGGSSTEAVGPDDGFSGIIQSSAMINDSGDLAFFGLVDEIEGNPVNLSGVFAGPDVLNDQVLLDGGEYAGETISDLELLGLNNNGQILLRVQLDTESNWFGYVLATPILDGDFDESGYVDSEDLADWEAGFGLAGTAEHTDGDADGDQDVDGHDFLVWQRELGMGDPPMEIAAAVPEPASAALAVLAAAGVLRLRRRR